MVDKWCAPVSMTRTPSRHDRFGAPRRLALAALLATGVVLMAASAAPAAASGTVSIVSSINGRQVAHSTASQPVRLNPRLPGIVAVTVTNAGGSAVTIGTVRVEGSVVGLSFYSYDTSVYLHVPARSSTDLRFSLDLHGLGGQATGLIPGSVQVLDTRHQVLASQPMVSDVQGSLVSVYGLFGLALLILTILAIVDVFLAMARHRLPRNRWRRALRFMTPGIGIGLVLVFSLSALRVWVPSPGTWLTVVLVFAAAFFLVGYLSPTPADDTDDEEDDEDDDLEAAGATGDGAAPAGAGAVGGLGLPP